MFLNNFLQKYQIDWMHDSMMILLAAAGPGPSLLAPCAAGCGAARAGPGGPRRLRSSPPPPVPAPCAAGTGAARIGDAARLRCGSGHRT